MTTTAAGVTIADNDPNTDNVTLTQNGLNNGGNTITNVKAGTANTDAANVGQVKDAANAATNNAPVVYTQADGTQVYSTGTGFNTAQDGTGTAVAPSDIITSVRNANGSTTTATKLSNVAAGTIAAASKDAVNGSQLFNANQSVAQALGTTVDANGQLNAPSYTIIDPKTGSQTSASVKEAFGDINSAINRPIGFAGDSGDNVTRKLGETLTVKGGANTNNLSEDNIGVVANGDNALSVQLAKDLTGLNSAQFTDKNGNQAVISASGTQVTDGTNTSNYGAASSTVTDGNNTTTTGPEGVTVSNGTDTSNVTADNITVGGANPVVVNGKDGVITGLTNTTYDETKVVSNRAATEGQVSDVANSLGDLADTPLTFTGNSGTTAQKLGSTLNVSGGAAENVASSNANVKTVVTNGKIDIQLLDAPTFAGQVKANGFDANNQKIVNVKDGTDTKDAVNKGQLDAIVTTGKANADALGNSTADNLGGGATYDSTTGKVSAPSYSVNNVTKNSVGEAISALDQGFTLQTNGTNAAAVKAGDTIDIGTVDAENNLEVVKTDNTIKYSLKKNLDLGKDGSVTTGNTVTNNAGVTVDDGDGNVTALTKAGTNVTDGTNTSNYGATGSTITDGAGNATNTTAQGTTVTDGKSTTNYGAEGLTFIDNTTGTALAGTPSITKEGISAGNTVIKNLAAGDVAKDSTDAINGNQLFETNQAIANAQGQANKGFNIAADNGTTENVQLGDTVNFTNTDGNLVATSSKNGINYDLAKAITVNSLSAEDSDGNKSVTTATGTRVTDGTNTSNYGANGITFLDTKGNTIANAPSISLNGIDAGNRLITNVGRGSVNSGSKDAINGGQLFDSMTSVTDVIGGNATVDKNGKVQASNIGGTGANNINDAIASVNQTANNAGFNLSANGTNAGKVKSGDTVDISSADGNVVVNKTGNNLSLGIADNLKVETITAGNTQVTTNGITIGNANDPSKSVSLTDKGLNNGGNQITGVASGLDGKTVEQIKAEGSKSEQWNKGATVGDLTQVQSNVTNVNNNVTNITQALGTKDDKGNILIDDQGKLTEDGRKALKTYNVSGQDEFVNNSIISAIDKMNEEGIKFIHVNDSTPGSQIPADGSNSIDSSAGGAYSTAIGYQSKVGIEATNSIAIGKGNNVNGSDSIAIGTGNIVNGNGSGAFGDPSIIDGNNSYSVGNDNKLATDKTFVLGNNVTKTAANSVNLGSESAAYTEDSETTAGTTTYNQSTIAGETYNYAGGKPAGVVSVGDVELERRLQNVAAGKISEGSTDAINGSQLYQTNQAITKVANSVDDLGYKLDGVQEEANAGISSAMAMASMPQAFLPGKSMISGGIATYNGEGAVAVGMSKLSDNGRWVIKINGSADTKGNAGAAAGVGMHW